jgi:hypothetical protein
MPLKFNPLTGKLDLVNTSGGGGGDVAGDTSSTNNAIARFDGTTGKSIKNSVVTIDDAGNVTGIGQLTTSSNIRVNGQAGAGNAFSILNRGGTNRFAAFQFQNQGSTRNTVGMYNGTGDDLIINADVADVGRRQYIRFRPNVESDFNAQGGDHDHRFRSSGDAQLLFLDGGENRVGIGTQTPTAKLDVNSDTVRVRTARTPASATAAGNAGDICWDSDYVYICVATNTWKRSALGSW